VLSDVYFSHENIMPNAKEEARMQTWLHFVGKNFYETPRQFAREAAQHGVSRRVAWQQACAMRFGDRVLLAQWDPRRNGAYVFGEFTLSNLFGAGLDALLADEERCCVSRSAQTVERECGMFVVATICALPKRLDIPDLLARATDPTTIGNLMVGGTYKPLTPYILKDIRHRQGFRLLDAALLDSAVTAGFERARCPVIRGQFYQWETPVVLRAEERQLVDGLVYEIEHYRTKGSL
jgi:hypothetical protein